MSILSYNPQNFIIYTNYPKFQDHQKQRIVETNFQRSLTNERIPNFPEKRNGSPSRSPSEKARRPYAPALEKTRLGGSGGSVDSRSGSASPDRGSSNRTFFHRGATDRSSVERLRISTNRDSLRSTKEMNDHEKDIDKDLVDGDARAEEDNEPPGPAPGSRPSSPANSLGG